MKLLQVGYKLKLTIPNPYEKFNTASFELGMTATPDEGEKSVDIYKQLKGAVTLLMEQTRREVVLDWDAAYQRKIDTEKE